MIKWLERYREICYLIFLLPQIGCVSIGLGSGDILYRVVFAVGVLSLLLSMAGTRYHKREILWMGIIAVLACVSFLQNRNRSLILACMAIFGCKNMDIKKILKLVFAVMAIGIAATVSLSALGVIPNIALDLPKEGGEMYTLYSYGFDTPNNLYFHLIILVLLLLVIWEKQMNWISWIAVTAVMAVAYKVLFSRTGWMCYLILLLMYFLYRLIKSAEIRIIYLKILVLAPIVLFLFNWACVYLYSTENDLLTVLDETVNHRISLAHIAVNNAGITWLGSRGAVQLDSLYMTMLLNYGIVLSTICIVVYVKTMWKLLNKGNHITVLAMTLIAVYSFMEVNAINPTWNPFLLYLSSILFSESALNKNVIGKIKQVS